MALRHHVVARSRHRKTYFFGHDIVAGKGRFILLKVSLLDVNRHMNDESTLAKRPSLCHGPQSTDCPMNSM
jgi:hypothetical protein